MNSRACHAASVAVLACIYPSATAELIRVANPDIELPETAPVGSYSVPHAFAGLTFQRPIGFASPVGDTERLFICEKAGLVRVIEDVTAANPSAVTFLDVKSMLEDRTGVSESLETSSECGVLGLAFHPDYATNRYFYLFYSVDIDNLLHQRVSRFTTSSGNPNSADISSEMVLIEQRDQAGNHNGGDLHFGPDGYLYITVGDEGDRNDSFDNSQTINKDLFAGILRIDVDKNVGNVEPTAHSSIPTDSGVARFLIPVDNPFVHSSIGGPWDGTYIGSAVSQTTVRREFYATGLRNPWRISFDPVTSELWCGDVGQNFREEIDIIENGGNYGWAFREADNPGYKNSAAPEDFDNLYHDKPIYEYARGTGSLRGNSVTGGRVYRGSAIPALYGSYIFGDHVSGNIWSLVRDEEGQATVERLTSAPSVTTFGVDPSNGDLLIGSFSDNSIRRLVSSSPSGGLPATLSETGLFSEVSSLTPAPGMTPYEVNLPFWSDHATKRRWFIVPDGTSRFSWALDENWTLPTGMMWVKHFDMEMVRGNPATSKRIETRVLVKTDEGSYGLSYRWRDDESEADLVDLEGADFDLDIDVEGASTVQPWRIPGRAECLICHTPQAGHALSFNSRQLNLESDILGCIGNQLETLDSAGYFSNSPGKPNLLPRHLRPDEAEFSTEARVRSYLAVNCAYCHMEDGTAGIVEWDGRPSLKLDETGLLFGELIQGGSDPLNKLIVPGDTTHSVVLSRVAVTNGFTRMPPLGNNTTDQGAIDLLSEWILSALPARQTYEDWRLAIFADDPDGAAGLDPDFDGAANEEEFLHGTNPLSGADRPAIAVTSDEGLKLGFTLPENRSFRILTSGDLSNWEPWDIPENQGLPVSGSLIEIELPTDSSRQFFSIGVSEN